GRLGARSADGMTKSPTRRSNVIRFSRAPKTNGQCCSSARSAVVPREGNAQAMVFGRTVMPVNRSGIKLQFVRPQSRMLFRSRPVGKFSVTDALSNLAAHATAMCAACEASARQATLFGAVDQPADQVRRDGEAP